MKNNGYEVNISISPLPRNCNECPFFYDVWENCMEGVTNCLLMPYQMDIRGCALNRSPDCPLTKLDDRVHEFPTEKQVEYAESIARKKGIKLNIAYTKQAYWEFINKNKDGAKQPGDSYKAESFNNSIADDFVEEVYSGLLPNGG